MNTGTVPSSWRDDQPQPGAVSLTYRHVGDLSMLRQAVKRYAAQVGMPADRIGEVVLAVTELATNTIRHTPGPGLLRVWQRAGNLIVEVSDQGTLPAGATDRTHPFPLVSGVGGYGLALVEKFSDEMLVQASPAVIRLRFSLPQTTV